METENNDMITINTNDGSGFDKLSIKTVAFDAPKGINLKTAKLSGKNKIDVIAVTFDTSMGWNSASAKQWVDTHSPNIKIQNREDKIDRYNRDSLEFSTKIIAGDEIKEDGGVSKGTFSGWANTTDRDRDDDIVEPGSFKKTIEESGNRRSVFFMHRTDSDNLVGGITDMQEKDIGLYVGGFVKMSSVVNGETILHKNNIKIFDMIKEGIIKEMSIGYYVIKAWFEDIIENNRLISSIRHITELSLAEISLIPVNMAANTNSIITDVKSDNHIIDYLTKNKNNKQLKAKIAQIFGYEPIELSTPLPEPVNNVTPKKTFWAHMYDNY